LPLYGDGQQQRAWVHVEDQAAAIELVLRLGERGGIYNFGTEARPNLEVSKLILTLVGADRDLISHIEDRPGHDRRYAVDSSRIEALGWKPARAFEEGLADTVAWYRERRDWWAPLKASVTA
jgi:dTDP-glucose 4,6-dehydratase